MTNEQLGQDVRPAKDPYVVDAILRACDVLSAFHMENEELRLLDIVERTKLHKATAHRTLHNLVRGGLVERVGSQHYRSRMRPVSRRRMRFGYTSMTAHSAFSRDVTDSVRRAAVSSDVELIELDNQYSARIAIRNAEKLVRERVDLAIQVQIHEDVAPSISAQFAEAGIPVIAVDIPQPGATFFGGNNYLAGRIGGQALARYALKAWDGAVDQLLLLRLAAAGPLPQSRMTGVAIGVQELLPQLTQAKIVLLDGNGGFVESMEAVRKYLRNCRGKRFLAGAMNDASALGALRAFEEAGLTDGRTADCAVMGQNATIAARAELRRPRSRLIGSVAFFPETYGEHIFPLALAMLQQKPVPPAVYVKHALITANNVNRFYPTDELGQCPDSDAMLCGQYH